jgi:hypothetical protein
MKVTAAPTQPFERRGIHVVSHMAMSGASKKIHVVSHMAMSGASNQTKYSVWQKVKNSNIIKK